MKTETKQTITVIMMVEGVYLGGVGYSKQKYNIEVPESVFGGYDETINNLKKFIIPNLEDKPDINKDEFLQNILPSVKSVIETNIMNYIDENVNFLDIDYEMSVCIDYKIHSYEFKQDDLKEKVSEIYGIIPTDNTETKTMVIDVNQTEISEFIKEYSKDSQTGEFIEQRAIDMMDIYQHLKDSIEHLSNLEKISIIVDTYICSLKASTETIKKLTRFSKQLKLVSDSIYDNPLFKNMEFTDKLQLIDEEINKQNNDLDN